MTEKELRQQIADEVANKLDYIEPCLNDRKNILDTILGIEEPFDSLCSKCNRVDCISYERHSREDDNTIG